MSPEPILERVTSAPMAAVSARVTPEQAGHVVFAGLDAVYAALRTGDYGPHGRDVVFCAPGGDGLLELRIGVRLERPFPGLGKVAGWATPDCEAIHVAHLGDYSKRGQAHGSARDAAARLGRRLTGVHWEVHGEYLPAAGKRRTDLYFELAEPADA